MLWQVIKFGRVSGLTKRSFYDGTFFVLSCTVHHVNFFGANRLIVIIIQVRLTLRFSQLCK